MATTDYTYRQVLLSFDAGEVSAAVGVKPTSSSVENQPTGTVSFRKRLSAADEAALDQYFKTRGFERVK